MKSNCSALRLAAIATLSMTGLASAAGVFDQIPQAALVVVKVNHLKQTSDKLAKLANDLGVAAFAPQMADPLGAAEGALGIKAGINEAGDLAFAFLDPATVGGDPDKGVLILLPVSDYKAFVGGLAGATTDAEITTFSAPGASEPTFFMQAGEYAVATPNKDVLTQSLPKGIKLPPMAMKEIDAKDAGLYANFAAIKAKALPQIQANRAQWTATVEDALKNNPQAAKYSPIFKAVVDQGINAAERFMTDCDAATVGLSITPEGINTTTMAEFAPSSYLGTTVSSLKNTDKPLLEGLPDGKYMIYGGSAVDPTALTKVLGDVLDPIAKEVAAQPDLVAATDYINGLKAMVGASKGSSFGLLAPTGAIGVEPLLQFVTVYDGEPKVIMDSFTKMASAQAAFMKAAGPQTAGMAAVHTPAAKTLDGVSFDQLVTKFDSNAQDPVAVQQAQVMAMLYGPNGAVVNYGAVGDKVLLASGIADPQLSLAIAAVKKGDAPVAAPEKVKSVAAQLPKERLGVFYIGVDDIVTTAMSYARQFGAPLNVQLPPDLSPIGVTVATDGPSIKIDSHIPTSLVQSLVAAGMQAQMQMRGGGGQPPAGGGM